MKKNIYLLSLLFLLSISSHSSSETFEENYACGVDMYMLSSIFRLSTEKGDNLELKNAAIREHTLWEKVNLSLLSEREPDIAKRKERLKSDMIKRLTSLHEERGLKNILSENFIDEATDGCFGDTKIQKVYNLYYAGIKNE
jgi:hypothetical protein